MGVQHSKYSVNKAKLDDSAKCLVHAGVSMLGLLDHVLTWSTASSQRGGLRDNDSRAARVPFLHRILNSLKNVADPFFLPVVGVREWLPRWLY